MMFLVLLCLAIAGLLLVFGPKDSIRVLSYIKRSIRDAVMGRIVEELTPPMSPEQRAIAQWVVRGKPQGTVGHEKVDGQWWRISESDDPKGPRYTATPVTGPLS